jgi:Winged helix DNA-binding domain
MTADALLTWPSVLGWRVRRHGLAERAPADEALVVVARIAGLHAQLLSSAELTLHARVGELDPDAVTRALWIDRMLVKTWAMRGTLHLLPAAELPAFVGAQGAIPPRHHLAPWLKHHGLTRQQADAMLAAIPEALADAELTREELATAVECLTGEPGLAEKLGGGFGDLLKPAAFAGDLCFAPNAGRSDEVAEVVLDGAQAFVLARDVEEIMAAEPAGTVNLLPAFDQYVVGAPRDAPAVLDPAHRAKVYRPQGWLSPVLLVDGAIAGTWSVNGTGGGTEIVVEPFTTLPAAVARRAESEAERLTAILAHRS